MVQDDSKLPRYPNLKEEVGGLISDCEISSLPNIITCQVINYPPMLWR